MPIAFNLNTPDGSKEFSLDFGTSILFVGANGGGKTRLAVYVEQQLGDTAHRISAHRALSLNPDVPKVSERVAMHGLRTGYANEDTGVQYRVGHRWKSKPTVGMLNDYDHVMQVLFAEQTNKANKTHNRLRAGESFSPEAAKLEILSDIWTRVLPHRQLIISGDNISVSIAGIDSTYSASDMSDGERAIFYLIGQVLVAPADSLIIFDEPELHVHRSIMSTLWDELTSMRPDCAIVFITHDLEFAASREGQKFVLRGYSPTAGWTIEDVPEDTGFSEEVTTLILGSRKPILFVEGQGTSLDKAMFRACYPEWTVIPRGSCEEVIHSVVTMRANDALTRVTCSGIVDADDYSSEEMSFLEARGIQTLPVSEIENIFLLPEVLRAIALEEGFGDVDADRVVADLHGELFAHALEPKNQLPVIAQYCRRRIDRVLKKLDLSDAKNIEEIEELYERETSALNVTEVAELARRNIVEAIESKNAEALLKWYDNKGVMAIASKVKSTTKTQFEQWILRSLLNKSAPLMSQAIKAVLPEITAN